MSTDIQVSPEQAFVDEAIHQFEVNPVNRDVALARCLYYLESLNQARIALDAAIPQLSALASGPMGKLLGVGK